jgi:hypothetical protein
VTFLRTGAGAGSLFSSLIASLFTGYFEGDYLAISFTLPVSRPAVFLSSEGLRLLVGVIEPFILLSGDFFFGGDD